jgi:hypothetical protein
MRHFHDDEKSTTTEQDVLDCQLDAICEDIDVLRTFFIKHYKNLSRKTISKAACSVVANDELDTLKLFYEIGRLSDFSKNLLISSVIYNAKQCFAFLIKEKQISIDILKYYDIYEEANKMKQEIEKTN